MSIVCNGISLVCNPYVTRMSSVCHWYAIRMSLVWTRMSPVGHSCVLICYSYVTCMSLLCTRISFVCHSYVLVCHPYVTRMWFYHEPIEAYIKVLNFYNIVKIIECLRCTILLIYFFEFLHPCNLRGEELLLLFLFTNI